MSDLLPEIATYFAAHPHWTTGPSERPVGIEVRHDLSGQPYTSYAHQLRGSTFVYDSLCPERAAPEHRAAVARFIARVNFELVIGTFSLDWATGAVRLRGAVDVRGQPLTAALIGGVVLECHQVMTNWLAHLMGVIDGELEPDAAFTEASEQLG